MKETDKPNVLHLILWILSLPLLIAGIIIDLCFLDKFRRKRNEKLLMRIKNKGKDIIGEITDFNHYDDQDDDEYTVIEFRIKLQIGSQTIYKESKFSMNTTHIDYAYHGLMINTPKTKYSVSDFYNAMKPGNKIRVRALLKPPYEYVIVGNELINEVIHEMLDSDTVWN